jgi:predicted ATPase
MQNLESTQERIWEAEIHRLKGLVLLRNGRHDDVEACFQTALRIAQGQQARLLELRAAISLARLLTQIGRADEAAPVLAQSYGWFTEGFGQPDLREGRAVLATLSARMHPPDPSD